MVLPVYQADLANPVNQEHPVPLANLAPQEAKVSPVTLVLQENVE
jgi:hypothetical protein